MDTYLRADDVRELLKLVGEAREIIDAGSCAHQHVMQGLARLAGAEFCVYFSTDRLSAPTPATVRRYDDHGWPDGVRRRVLDYYEATSGTGDPVMGALLRARRRERQMTVRRTDVVSNQAWHESSLHNDLHRPVGFGDVMVSVRFADGSIEGGSAIVLKRAAGRPPFSVEERDLLHLFRSESDWALQRQATPREAIAPGLTPREQETLRLLLTDASEKAIAAQLGLSPHTVHDYVKRLYRKLGVASRAALMARAQPRVDRGARPSV